MDMYEKNDRVSHDVYGTGTVTRMTKRPVRVWVKWDETGLTSAVNPDSVRGVW